MGAATVVIVVAAVKWMQIVVAVVAVAVERMQINANTCRWIKFRRCNQGV